jgi:hypothetical protein
VRRHPLISYGGNGSRAAFSHLPLTRHRQRDEAIGKPLLRPKSRRLDEAVAFVKEFEHALTALKIDLVRCQL